ncbi:hypothetical protein P167DRAFT_409390 [Morchella conica CCBAS932]|uniref:Uncharacterized protein n=1 Tax=Morchella conica CCBAS932 TaxID=1392247 RepID=A0A3N4L1Q9_9PEZI|nr:hypothetical protein P167DRAFT_409390 [Morchella conica CCBAS932]
MSNRVLTGERDRRGVSMIQVLVSGAVVYAITQNPPPQPLPLLTQAQGLKGNDLKPTNVPIQRPQGNTSTTNPTVNLATRRSERRKRKAYIQIPAIYPCEDHCITSWQPKSQTAKVFPTSERPRIQGGIMKKKE